MGSDVGGGADDRPAHRAGEPAGLTLTLAGLEVAAALAGVLWGGGDGTRTTTTTRGAEVVLLGDGLYAWDSWLVGAGNRGQDLVMLLVEVPVLLLALRRWRYGGPLVPARAPAGGRW